MSGSAYTPRGEIIGLDLYGTMHARLNRFTDGETITLDISYSPVLSTVFDTEHRPTLSFRGQWQNPNMVLIDTGSLSYACQPDGTVYSGHDPNRRPPKEIVPLTLKPGAYAVFKASCPATRPDSR